VTKKSSQTTKDQIKDIIIQTVKKEKPETAKQLFALMQEQYAIPPKQTTNLLVELEKEDRLHFTRHEPPTPASAKGYVVSKQATWYWITIAFIIVTAIILFTIPNTAYPLVYLRSTLSIIFVLFLPGFTFIDAVYPGKGPFKTSSENMDTIERVALSFGMSIVIVPTVGLILNYTPWGIRLTPITLSLIALTVVFATVAMLREQLTKLDRPAQEKH
jgi:hypothetical protein